MIWDYVFVGAGPASLIAAGFLARRRASWHVLVLEAGSSMKHRGCPGLRRRTCTNCSGDDCRVTMGVGGSSAGFGNKLCHFPASADVLSLVPEHLRGAVEQIVQDVIGRCHSSTDVQTIPSAKMVERKFYAADVKYRREYGALLEQLLGGLAHAELRQESPVRSIRRNASGFAVELNSGELVEARNVILGVGRSGHNFVRATLDSLGLGYQQKGPDIGLRLEAPNDAFNEGFFYQNDPKFKFDHGTLGTSRTFCACRGGRIIPVKYGNGFFADGAFLSEPTEVSNIALMVRTREELPYSAIDEWCATVNHHSGGSLLLDSVELDSSFLRRALAAVPVWPLQTHRLLMAELLENIVEGSHAQMFRRDQPKVVVRVYGPAVDQYWPSPELSTGFHTAIDGLSLIGDAAGLSRGIVQALVSGAAWALQESVATGVFRGDDVFLRDSTKAA